MMSKIGESDGKKMNSHNATAKKSANPALCKKVFSRYVRDGFRNLMAENEKNKIKYLGFSPELVQSSVIWTTCCRKLL